MQQKEDIKNNKLYDKVIRQINMIGLYGAFGMGIAPDPEQLINQIVQEEDIDSEDN